MRLSAAFILTLSVFACGPGSDWDAAEPPATPVQAERGVVSTRSHLRVSGTSFVDGEGMPFAWRGISAFRLLEMIARGREHEAAAFLDWGAAKDLTVVRVLSMAHHLFRLTPAEGIAALPRLLEMAAARGLHVEVVALADTRAIRVDTAQHVRAIGEIAARHGNALIEIANEPVHPTQRTEVHNPATLTALAAAVPPGVPVALGSIERGDGFAAGAYVTWHVPRTYEPGGWGHVLAIADGAQFVRKWKKPVVSDEPVGAAARFAAGRRDNVPARFRAAAIVTRLAGLGATFHYEGGLEARIPQGRELECFEAWNEAWRLLPAGIEHRGAFARAGDEGSAVAGYDQGAAAAVYERRTDTEAWAVAVGVTRDPQLRFSDGWRAVRTDELPGVRVVTMSRTSGAN